MTGDGGLAGVSGSGGYGIGGEDETGAEELEVVEIVKYKLVFSQRPEPVSKR
jgi:chromosome transmission fidelity protein 8